MLVTPQTNEMLMPHVKKGFHDLAFADYLKMYGASSHGLMDIRRSPKYYKFRRENQNTSKAMNLGTLVHMLILEPQEAEKRIKVAPKVDKRTTAGKLEYQNFKADLKPGDVECDFEDYQTLMGIKKSLYANKFAKDVITRTDGINEQAGFWIHDETQTFCKIKPDRMFLSGDIVLDIKTTQNAHPAKFSKDIYNFNYDMQAAFYIDGYRAITGRFPQFIILAIETSAPYDVAAYHITDKIYGFGRLRYQKALMTYANCFKNDSWPGYAEGVVPLDLPHWAETAEQTMEDVEAFVEEHL